MFFLIQNAVGFGVIGGLTPGPLLTYIINETLLHGWRHSIYIIITPLLTDAPIILLSVVVLEQFPDAALTAVSLVGGLFVLWMAYSSWRRSNQAVGVNTDVATLRRYSIARGMLVNLLSPAPYIYWGTVTGPLLVDALDESVWWGLAFLLAFYGPFMLTMTLIALVFNRMRHLNERIVRGLLRFAALLMMFFGLSLIAQGAGLT